MLKNQFNLVFVTRKWKPYIGGMEQYSIKICEKLSKHYQLIIIKPKLNFLPFLFNQFLFIFQSIFQLLLVSRYKVLHIGDMALWPLAFFAKRNSKIFVSAHGTDIAFHLRKGMIPYVYGFYLKLGSYFVGNKITVIANSVATLQITKSHGFKNIKVVTLGVDLNEIIPKKNSFSNNNILFVGRLIKRKGASWFIQNVLPLLPNNFKFIVCGTPWDKSELEVIKNNDRVTYLGPVVGRKLQEIRNKSLLVVMPNQNFGKTDFEGFGLTAVEASANGTIILASSIDGINDAVVDGKTGWLLPPDKPTIWKDKIIDIANMSISERLMFIKKSQNIIKKIYTWDVVVKKTIDIYESKN